jgi:hypothetical protein
MTQVHAVEVADRDCAPAMLRAQVVQSAHEFHRHLNPAVRGNWGV